jgi:chemotaxis protein methyltransferase WspC
LTSKSTIDCSAVATWLADFSGISTGIIGHHTLQRAVGERLEVTGLDDVTAYLELLLSSPQEQQNLVELVVVPETWFFRDRQPFVHLRAHISALIAGGLPSQPLRLLSAPCASGEEPYSLAMTLLDMGLPADCFRIDAIDICRQSIRKARQAVYGKHSFRGVSEAEKAQNFQVTPQGLALNPAIRQTVDFKCANLMRCLAETGSNYDVIFCRNLLIYLEEAASQHLLESFATLMRPGALLIVGSAETGKVPPSLFQPIRESFVFGFLRREEPSSLPPAAASSSANSADALTASAPASATKAARGGVASPARPRRRERPARPPSLETGAARRRALRAAGPANAVARTAGRARSSGEPATGQELDECRQELERNPYCDATYLRLAQLLELGNQTDAAIDCLQRCLYLQPNSRQALEAVIALTKQTGQIERSRQFQGRLARLLP